MSRPEELLNGAEDLIKGLKNSTPEMPAESIEEELYFRKTEGLLLSNQGAFMQKKAMLLRKEAKENDDEEKEAQAMCFFKAAEAKHKRAAQYRGQLLRDMHNKLNEDQICQLKSNLANSYKNIATEQYQQGKFSCAIENHQKAIDIFKKINSRSNLAISQALLAGCVIEANQEPNSCTEISVAVIDETLDQLCSSILIFYENKNYKMLNECFNKLDKFNQLFNREAPLQPLAVKLAKLCDEM